MFFFGFAFWGMQNFTLIVKYGRYLDLYHVVTGECVFSL